MTAATRTLHSSYPTTRKPLTRDEEQDLIRKWQQQGDRFRRQRYDIS